MTPQLEIGIEGRLGVVALNRPEAINALSRGMIDGITQTLLAWRDDPAIGAVLFEGRGAKGFCAGGDVRAVRAAVIEGRTGDAEAYFTAEYQMNGLIAAFPKPLIALAPGIVMGGGIGIAGHAAFRLTAPGARFAMPESAIGFFCDVGVNAILSKAPLNRALLFMMSGASVGAADALALGLSDCAVLPERLADVRAGLVEAAGAPRPEQAIVLLMEAESIVAGTAEFTALADLLPAEAPGSASAFVETVNAVPQLAALATLLKGRSPTSLETIFRAHMAARLLPDTASVLALDVRVAHWLARQPDFAEGVRAVLVDKDQAPKWHPAGLEGVDGEHIAAVVAAR